MKPNREAEDVEGQEKYVCDASSLINLHRHFKGKCMRRLRQLVEKEELCIPEGVARELRRGTDRLSEFIKRWEEPVVIRLRNNPRLQAEVVRVERLYGNSITVGEVEYKGFWASPAGRKAADSQVVAVAKIFGCTVVSDDNAVKLACAQEDVPCIGWTEFARRLGLLRLARQLPLFDYKS